MLTIVPSSAIKAIESGRSVLRIQKHCTSGCSNTNSMPSLPGSSLRNIRPSRRVASVSATSARIIWMPADSWVVRKAGCGPVWFCALAGRGRAKTAAANAPAMVAPEAALSDAALMSAVLNNV
ncbi:hypothetical protein D3C85_1597540 [compost metagenome]